MYRKLTLLFISLSLFSCRRNSSEIKISANIKLIKHKIQIVFQDTIPKAVERICFFEGDSLRKKIENVNRFSKGDTINIEWNFKADSVYSLNPLGNIQNTKFYTFEHTYFRVDAKADTLVFLDSRPLKIDTTHKSVTY